MSLNCLSCGNYNATPERGDGTRRKERSYGVRRCWSGDLTPPPPYAHLRTRSIPANGDGANKGRRRKASSPGRPLLGGGDVREGAAQPRLARSRGMRRDWNFEKICDVNANARKA